MNSFLISVGVTIVLALSAALIGPAFIDWNGYRAAIQEAGARLTGRQVVISGALDVIILPAPVLRAKKVTLFNPDEGKDTPLATAREVVLKLDLGALLLGRVEITDLNVIGARLRLRAGLDGTVNWSGVGGARSADTAGTALRRVVLSDATLEFADAATSVEHRLTGLDAEITAATLAGPFRLVGSFGDARSRRKIALSIGTIRAGGPLPVSGQVDVALGAQLNFDGTLAGWDKPLRYTGRVRLVKPLAGGAPEGGEPGRLVVEAQVDAGMRDAQITDLALSTSGTGQSVNLAGSGRLDWRADPTFNVELKALRLDIDALLAPSDPARPVARSLGAIAGLAEKWLDDTRAGGQLALKAGGVVLSGELIQNLDLAIDVADGEIGIEVLKALVPGQTDLSVSGTIMRGDDPRRFSGKVSIDALDFGRFVKWAVPERYGRFLAVLPTTRGKLSLRAGLEAKEGRFTLSGIEALLNGQAVSGEIALTPASPGEMRVNLSFDTFDLDRRAGAGGAGLFLMGGDEPRGGGAGVTRDQLPVFRLGLNAKRLRWRGQEALNAKLDATFEQGRWVVAGAGVDNFAGAEISASGSLAVDMLAPQAGTGAPAQMSLVVKTPDLPELIKALPGGAWLLNRLGADQKRQMREAVVEVGLKTRKTAKGWWIDGSATGVVGATSIDFKGTGEAEPGNLAGAIVKASLELANRRADRLLVLLGLPARDLRESAGATASLTLQSSAGAPLQVTASARVGDTQFTLAGALDPAPLSYAGKAKIRAESSAVLAGLMNMAAPDKALPVALDFDFSGDGAGLSVGALSGRAAGARLLAAGEVVFGARPRAALALSVDNLSLPWLVGSLFLSPAADTGKNAANGGDGGTTWSTDLVDTEILDLADVDIKAAVGRLAVSGGFSLYNAGAALGLAGAALRIAGLSARLGAGEDAGEVRADIALDDRDFTLGLTGDVTVADADLARLLTDASGRALAQGRLGMQARFSARGRSLLSLVSSLEGAGKLTVTQAAIPRLDWAGLRNGSRQAAISSAGGPGSVSLLFEQAMSGRTPLTLEPGAVEAANGRIKFGPLIARAAGARGEVTSFVDLPARRFDQELVLGAPNAPRLALIHAGPLADIGREIEVTNLANVANGAIRIVEPPDTAERPKRAAPSGALPALPAFVKIRTAPVPPPQARVPLPDGAPALTASRPPAPAPVKPEPVAGPSLPRKSSVPKIMPDRVEDDTGEDLPAGLIEQRLIDLPLPATSGAAPDVPPAPGAKPPVPPA